MNFETLAGIAVGAALTAIFQAVVNGRQKREEDQRRDTGQRMGALERSRDYWQGWFDCWKEHHRGSDAK